MERTEYCVQSQESSVGYIEVAPTASTNRHPVVPFRIPKSDKRITINNSTYHQIINYTDYLNSWINRNHILYDRGTYQHNSANINCSSLWYYERQIKDQKRTVVARAQARSLAIAKGLCSKMIWDEYSSFNIVAQMDSDAPKESDQGLAIQDSTKDSNTIITRDEANVESHTTVRNDCVHYASSEPSGSFEMITSRWMPLKSLEVSISQEMDHHLADYYLPDTLYKLIDQSANLVPFETFIYAEMDITFKFVVNANKFQCGKVIASAKFDSYQADALQASARSALHRPHVILDLASNNEGTLHVPFRYHRALVRLSNKGVVSRAVRAAKYASVYVQVLSPLRTGTDNSTTMFIRPFVKLEHIRFCGISHRISLQMDAIAGGLGSSVLRHLLTGAESLLRSDGTTPNRDKPTDNRSSIIIPRARMNFGTGKGPTDALPLRVDPTTLTNFNCISPYPDEPQSTLDIARIWGLRSSFTWNASNVEGELLYDFVVDPSSRQYSRDYVGIPTPLEYVTSLYNFWSGTIEMRIDFVSNAFHTGAVQIAVEFGRPSTGESDEHRSASTYTKTFHLGEQKSVHMTIPYIYDTVWRRCCTLPYNPSLLFSSDRNVDRQNALAVFNLSYTRVSIRVINALRPVPGVPQEIDCLLYWRASPSYSVHSLKQGSFYFVRENARAVGEIDAFPIGYLTSDAPEQSRRKRDTTATGNELPAETSNEYNEYSEGNIPSYLDAYLTPSQEPEDDDVIVQQMDSGSKEDRDSTADFAIGPQALHVQTSDAQVNIKDILRRPVLLFNNVHIDGLTNESTHGFYIPLMPPSRNFSARSYTSPELTCHLVAQTPQAQLMSLFRFWRGSMRYTIVVEEQTSAAPIYITHVPHSGVRRIGNSRIGDSSQGDARNHHSFQNPIYGCGLTTEMLIPQVNPTIQVEVPFDTENNWCLTFEEDPQRHYTWRDKGDTNTGHLVISSQKDARVSIFWTAGDDFEVSNFYGIPQCASNDRRFALPDVKYQIGNDTSESFSFPMFQDYPLVVQGPQLVPDALQEPLPDTPPPPEDFLSADEGDSGSSVSICQRIQNTASRYRQKYGYALGLGAAAMATQIPVVGPMMLSASVGTAAYAASNALNDLTEITGNLKSTVNAKIKQVDDLTESLCGHLLSAFDKALTSLAIIPSVLSGVKQFLYDMAMAILSKSWIVVGGGLLRLLGHILQVDMFKMVCFNLVTRLQCCFENLLNPGVKQQGPSDTSTLVGIIFGLVGLALGANFDEKTHGPYIMKLSKSITSVSGLSYLNNAVRLFNSIFEIIKDTILYWFGFVNPQHTALALLSKQSPLIEKFVADAQLVTSEANANMLLVPSFRTKFWLTLVNACQIQSILARVPNNASSPVLMKLCADVITAANTRMVDIASCPVRFEPMTICITGKPRIGKSYLNEHMCLELLDAVKFNRQTSGIVYVRQPGAKFWSNFRDQPVVTYDDLFNLNDKEAITQTLSEIYMLKSPVTFTPEMAHLDEKKVKANPFLVTFLCNDAFPSHIDNIAIHKDAVYGRRNYLVEARLKNGYTTDSIANLTEQESKNKEHLEFCFHKNPMKKEAGYENEWLTWSQFIERMKKHFVTYYDREKLKVMERTRKLQSHLMGLPESQINLDDPMMLLQQAEVRIYRDEADAWSWLPSRQLDLAVKELATTITDEFQLDRALIEHRPSITITPPNSEVDDKDIGISHQAPVPPPTPEEEAAAIVELPIPTFIEKLRNLSLRTIYPTRKCYNCECLQPVVRKCLAPEDKHFVCSQCYDQLATKTCCACGLSTTSTLLPQAIFEILQLFKSIKKFAGRELSWQAKIWEDKSVEDLLYLNFKIITLAHLASELKAPWMVPVASALNYAKCVRDRLPIHNELPNVQELMPLTFPDLVERVKLIEPNMSRHKIFLSQQSEVSPCPHGVIYEHLPTATLSLNDDKELEWRVFYVEDDGQGFVVTALDKVCADTQCILRHEETCFAFYHEYSRIHQLTLRQQYVDYVLQPRKAAQIRSLVPFMLRPIWMAPAQVEIKSDWWEYLGAKYDKHKTLIKIMAGLSAAVGTLYGAYKVYSHFNTPPPPSAIPTTRAVATSQGLYDADATRHLKRVQKSTRITGKNIEKQGDKQHQVVAKLVAENYVTIRVWSEGSQRRFLTGLIVCDKLCIMPRHFMTYLLQAVNSGMILTIDSPCYNQQILAKEGVPVNQSRQRLTICSEDFCLHPTTDLAWLRLPASFPSGRDIRKHFALDKDLDGYLPSSATILTVPHTIRKKSIEGHPIIDYQHTIVPLDLTILDLLTEIETDRNTDAEIIRDVISYEYSQSGACGSALIAHRHQRPILSIHVAGSDTYPLGYGALITQELIKDFLPQDIVLQMEEVQLDSFSERDDAFLLNLDANIRYLGVVPKGQEHFTPTKTKLRPSLIQNVGKLKPQTEPAILHRRDPRYNPDWPSPLSVGVSKHGIKTIDPPSSIVNAAASALYEGWFYAMKPGILGAKVLTNEEAVTGFPGVEFYDPMKLNTSAGYPWSIWKKGQTTKEAWLTITRADDGTISKVEFDPKLLSELSRKEDLRKQGIQPLTLFADTLKDERKLPEKVRKLGGTRVFCACPIDYTIEMRKHILHFCAAMMKDKMLVMSAVGINAKGTEWSDLYYYLTSNGTNRVVALDYSNFGPGFNAVIGKAAAKLIARWCSVHVEDANEDYIYTLLMECVNSAHIAHNLVYQQQSGSPSGAPMTAIFNSVVNLIHILVAWKAIVRFEPGTDIWYIFRKHVRLVVYGDDLIMSVSTDFVKQFNARTIQEFFATYNIVATSSDKHVGDLPETISIFEATFLKRGFLAHPQRPRTWLSPLSKVSVNDACQWIWSCADEKAATIENCNSALLEAHGWGPVWFNEFKEAINEALCLRGLKSEVITKTWADIDDLFFSNYTISDLPADKNILQPRWHQSTHKIVLQVGNDCRDFGYFHRPQSLSYLCSRLLLTYYASEISAAEMEARSTAFLSPLLQRPVMLNINWGLVDQICANIAESAFQKYIVDEGDYIPSCLRGIENILMKFHNLIPPEDVWDYIARDYYDYSMYSFLDWARRTFVVRRNKIIYKASPQHFIMDCFGARYEPPNYQPVFTANKMETTPETYYLIQKNLVANNEPKQVYFPREVKRQSVRNNKMRYRANKNKYKIEKPVSDSMGPKNNLKIQSSGVGAPNEPKNNLKFKSPKQFWRTAAGPKNKTTFDGVMICN